VFLIALSALPQTPDPAYEPLTKAFEALRGRDYDSAVVLFQKAAKVAPNRADIRKNLAYALLKTGETELAREQFGEAARLEPGDFHVALEYAFLCFEARDDAPARRAEARRIFLRVRKNGDPESRVTAAAAFQNVDEPLAAGIARWQHVLAGSEPTFSAHYELAQLAEQRDELELASTQYRAAFQMLPERKGVLLELAPVLTARGDGEGAMAALLAASRGGEPRAAELAKERMPERYPFVYEFRKALEPDPNNSTLHRELAYLLLSMSEGGSVPKEDSLREFEALVAAAPADYLAIAQLGLLYLEANREDAAMPLLQKVLEYGDSAVANRVRMALKMPLVLEEQNGDAEQADPRIMGERSYASGFLKDALRYFTAAREQNPVDGAIALKLGWTNNLLHDDRTALHWFDVARQSADQAVASEAEKAWENLRPGLRRVQTTVWIYPLFSSRWNDAFGYGQAKTALRLDRAQWLRPYVSVRYAGDVRRNTGGVAPQNLSESAFIFALGVATTARHGVVAWGEAGHAVSYMSDATWADYRGGVSWSSIHRRKDWFLESGADSVFISHFQTIGLTILRIGWAAR
jgi:Tfp pilus assembly protein PilF